MLEDRGLFGLSALRTERVFFNNAVLPPESES
jgi:hypothetical protein